MDIFSRHKAVSMHLSNELREKYKMRAIPVRKGDTVTIIKGSHKGKEGKVAEVSMKKMKISIEDVVISKADNTKVQFFISPGNGVITKLNLSDKKRKILTRGEVSEQNNA